MSTATKVRWNQSADKQAFSHREPASGTTASIWRCADGTWFLLVTVNGVPDVFSRTFKSCASAKGFYARTFGF